MEHEARRHRQGLSPVLAILLMIPVTGFVLLALWQAAHPAQPSMPIPATSLVGLVNVATTRGKSSPIEGEPATDFTLTGLDGKRHSLQDYLGKPVILNFWATWCAPCRVEMPLLETTYQRLNPSGLVVLAVNNGEDADTAHAYADELHLTFPILLDTEQSVVRTYEILGLPTTFFVDSRGIIRAKQVGLLTRETLQAYLDQLAQADAK